MSRTEKPGGTRNSADIIAVMGASGTGKSSYIKGDLLKVAIRAKRPILVWSPLEETDQYAEFCKGVVANKITDLISMIKKGRKSIVYQATGHDKEFKAQFDRFCRVAWELTNTTVLVEELSQVTMPSWAPPAWKKLSTAGRHKGLTIIGVSQRPANIDKDFLGNCSEIRCYRLNYEEDCKVLANVMRLPSKLSMTRAQAIDAIGSLPNFHYFHKNPDLSVRQGVNKAL